MKGALCVVGGDMPVELTGPGKRNLRPVGGRISGKVVQVVANITSCLRAPPDHSSLTGMSCINRVGARFKIRK